MENKIEFDDNELGKVIQKCAIDNEECPHRQKWTCAGCEHYSEEWNVRAYINGLKWILQDDKFGMGTEWPKGSTPRNDVENAGYIITRTLEYLEGLVRQ